MGDPLGGLVYTLPLLNHNPVSGEVSHQVGDWPSFLTQKERNISRPCLQTITLWLKYIHLTLSQSESELLVLCLAESTG